MCFRVVRPENFRKYRFIAENAIAVVTGTVELFESEYHARLCRSDCNNLLIRQAFLLASRSKSNTTSTDEITSLLFNIAVFGCTIRLRFIH